MESRRERKKQQTRGALLDAALSLFAERGIHGTRVEDVTERVDLGKGAFYNYFTSKYELVAVLVRRGVETFEQEYLATLDASGDLSSRVGQLARLHGAFFDRYPQYALLFHQTRGLLHLKDTNVESLRQVFADYLLRVGRAMVSGAPESDAGKWSDAALMDVAAALVGGVSGYRSYRIAASLPRETTAEEILAAGIPRLLETRQESSPLAL